MFVRKIDSFLSNVTTTLYKWGFYSKEKPSVYNSSSLSIDKNYKNILVMNCGIGNNLAAVVSKYNDKSFYVIEDNKSYEPIIKSVGAKWIDDYNNDKYKNFFDCIIISDYDILNDEKNIISLLKYFHKDSGLLILDSKLDSEKLKEKDYFNINELRDKLIKLKLNLESYNRYSCRNNDYLTIYFELINRNRIENKVSDYLYKGELAKAEGVISRIKSFGVFNEINEIKEEFSEEIKFLESVKFTLRRADIKDDDVPEDIFIKIDEKGITNTAVINIINHNMLNKSKILNLTAVKFFELNKFYRVLPYLYEALKIDGQDIDTIINIAYILNYFGEKDKALNYLESLRVKSDDVNNLIYEIKGVN